MSEIICVHVGRSGGQIGISFWKAAMQEFNISQEGTIEKFDETIDPNVLFCQNEQGIYVPRAVFVDTDGEDMNRVREIPFLKQLEDHQFVSMSMDASGIFSKGRYNRGRELQAQAGESTTKEIEKGTNLDSILVFNCFSGGTGGGFAAGFGSLLKSFLEKVNFILVSVFPSGTTTQNAMEIYNFMLSFNEIFENADLMICYDNENLFRIGEEKLSLSDPTFDEINGLIAQSLISVLNNTYAKFVKDSNGSGLSQK